jgi:hypothetical protein
MIPEAIMTSMSQIVPHLYIKGVFNKKKKSYNKLPEKIKTLHLVILKKILNQYFCKTVSTLGVVT